MKKEPYYVVAKSVSRWKLNNKLENLLGYLADKSDIWKSIYVMYYKIFDRKYYLLGEKLIEQQISKQYSNNETLKEGYITPKQVKKDMIYSLHRFGASFEEYFVLKFYEKNHYGRAAMNNLKMQYGFCELVNSSSIRNIFEDKGKCYTEFREFYKRDLVCVYEKRDLASLNDFLRHHTSFIYKPLTGHSGGGIKIYKDISNDILSLIYSKDSFESFVLEELIEQDVLMGQIHDKSINTVRIATFNNRGNITIVGAALRMGTGNSQVDNAGAGGIYATIDIETGIVNSIARDNINNCYTLHPDTKFQIVGFHIPEWNKMVAIVETMAKKLEGATMIAWDMAYSIKGWCMVEGNDVGEPYLLQAPYQVGLKYSIHKLIHNYKQSSNDSF